MYTVREALRSSLVHWLDVQIEAEDLSRVVLVRMRGRHENATGIEYTAAELARYPSTDALVDAVLSEDTIQSGGKHKLIAWHQPAPGADDNRQTQGKQITITPSKVPAGDLARAGASGSDQAAGDLGRTLGSMATNAGEQAGNLAAMVAEGQRDNTQLILDLFTKHTGALGEKDAEILRLNAELAEVRADLRFTKLEQQIQAAAPSVTERIELYNAVGTMATNLALNLMMAWKGGAQQLPAPDAPA